MAEGAVVIIRYEGPKGGPGMQEMLYPTSYLKSKGLGKSCALLTDGRFSGGTLMQSTLPGPAGVNLWQPICRLIRRMTNHRHHLPQSRLLSALP